MTIVFNLILAIITGALAFRLIWYDIFQPQPTGHRVCKLILALVAALAMGSHITQLTTPPT